MRCSFTGSCGVNMKYSAEPIGRPAANGTGNPPGDVQVYSEAINELVKKRLEGNEPEAVSHAAYLISKHGSAANEQVLRRRLARWRKEWGGSHRRNR